MNTFITEQIGRVAIIHLSKGEPLLESVRQEIKRLDIQDGVLLSAIGSLRRACFHVITTSEEESQNQYITLDKPMELGAMQGLVLAGEPHFHIIFSDLDRVYTGHLEDGCEVQYLAELSLLELKGLNLTRKLDAFGIGYITHT